MYPKSVHRRPWRLKSSTEKRQLEFFSLVESFEATYNSQKLRGLRLKISDGRTIDIREIGNLQQEKIRGVEKNTTVVLKSGETVLLLPPLDAVIDAMNNRPHQTK